jgi:hypothetical protein
MYGIYRIEHFKRRYPKNYKKVYKRYKKNMKNKRIVQELKRIAEKHGNLLKPEIVVQCARQKTSPLHKYFEWNNSEAAEKYRIWQARQLLAVTVEYIQSSREPVQVFVSLKPDRKTGGYRVLSEVLTDAEMRQQMLADAKADMDVFIHKYKRLTELASVFSVMKKVLKRK